MRVVVQRVSEAKVTVDGVIVGEIDEGILVLVGLQALDDDKSMGYIINKLIGLRIFEDCEGKMNVSLSDRKGAILLVPNFTIYGDCKKGNRPSFISAAKPDAARILFERFVFMAKERYNYIETGTFQTDMKVSLINDGPVTLIIDSDRII
ncbi:MAG: D-aminoacyl-tRNA deacylase [Vallitaleaceae bacterium]|nr:D-aminoacyl-tRNA deacylase [Vallitaleaceae bacterium]